MLNIVPHRACQLYRAEQVRAIDRGAIEKCGIDGMELMERAARSAYRCCRRQWPRARSYLVFCGAGNNAGDGYVFARLAHENGYRVTLVYLSDPQRLRADALTAMQLASKAGVKMQAFQEDQALLGYDVVVDGLLGTGLSGAVKNQYARAIHFINQQSSQYAAKILALDIPSGIQADTGCVMGTAVKADVTVSFIAMKQGLLTAQAPDYVGQCVFETLDVPSIAYQAQVADVLCLNEHSIVELLPPLAPSRHKGQAGHLLIIGGNQSMAGAAMLAGEAALRAGVGKCSIATHPANQHSIVSYRPELMCHGIQDERQLFALLEQVDAVVLGPGLGQDIWAQRLISNVLDRCRTPKLLDADALNLLANDFNEDAQWILTPHPGEASRLLSVSTAEIQANRFAAVRQIQEKYGGVCVLKGPGTLIQDSHQRTLLCSLGNPGMATAGMGDVLAGIGGSLLAQGFELNHAAAVAVYVHARAADMIALQGCRGLIASDLMSAIKSVFHILDNGVSA